MTVSESRICGGQQKLCNELSQNLRHTRNIYLSHSCGSLVNLLIYPRLVQVVLLQAANQAGIGVSQLKSVLSSIPGVLIMGASLKWQELPRCSLFRGDDRNLKNVGRNTQFLRNINLERAHCHSYLHSTNPCKSHGQALFPWHGKTHSTHSTKQYCKAT